MNRIFSKNISKSFNFFLFWFSNGRKRLDFQPFDLIQEKTWMTTTRIFLLFVAILTCSNFVAAQTFFIPPLDTGVVGNGARTYNLQLQNDSTEFFPEIFTATSGYNGSFLGPTLLMTKGDSVVMNVTNTMPFATTTHWHGMHLPAVMDGGPHQPQVLRAQWSTGLAPWFCKFRTMGR